MKAIKLFLAGVILAAAGSAQTTPQALLITRIYNIGSAWAGECAAGVVDNRSQNTRRNNYHSIYASGSGSWTVAINYSDTACTGPWTTFGSASAITQASNPPIAYANGYHPFIQIVVTGAAIATYSAAKDFFLSTSVGSLSFPITVAQGGSGAGTFTLHGVLYGNGTSALGATAAGTQYQVFQAGGSGVPTVDAVHLDQAAAISGNLPTTNGGTGSATAGGARTNLGAAASGANTDITSIGGLTTPLSITQGGTAAITPAAARASLGVPGLADSNTFTGANTFAGATHTSPTKVGTASAKPATCTQGEMYFATDATAGQNFYYCTATDTWTAQSTSGAFPSGTQTQFFRLKPNAGNNTTVEAASFPYLYAPDYNFPAQTVGSLLAGVANTITLTPCPDGISATTTNSYLYFTGAPGSPEAIQITGGGISPCTSGAATGTVLLDSVNASGVAVSAHTTPSVVSATGGLQEAMNLLPSGTGTVLLNPQSAITMHAPVTCPVGRSTVNGQNQTGFTLTRAADYTAGPLITTVSGSVCALQNVGITNTGGTVAALKIIAGAAMSVVNSQISGGSHGVESDSGNSLTIAGSWAISSTTSYGIWLHSTTGVMAQNTGITGGYIFPAAGGNGILIEGADIVNMVGTSFGGARISIFIYPKTGEFANNLYFTGLVMDGPTYNCVSMATAGGGSAQGIHFLGGHCHGAGTGTNQIGIDVGFNAAFAGTDVTVQGMRIAAMGGPGILQGAGGSNFVYSGNIITDCNISNDATNNAGIVFSANAGTSTISGNMVKSPGTYTGHQAYGIKTLGAAAGLTIVGNDLSTNGTGAISFSVPPTVSVIRNNKGLDDVTGTVADAATVAIPLNPYFALTGTGTTVTAFTGVMPAGYTWTMLPTDASPPPFTASASVGNSCVSPIQNTPYTLTSDGTKVWINGKGCDTTRLTAATNSTSSIGSTALLTAPAAGTYRVFYTLTTGSVSGGSGTALVTIGWSDAVGAKTSAGAALTLAAAANQSGTVLVNVASGNITYATTYSAGSGGNYNLTLTVDRM